VIALEVQVMLIGLCQ